MISSVPGASARGATTPRASSHCFMKRITGEIGEWLLRFERTHPIGCNASVGRVASEFDPQQEFFSFALTPQMRATIIKFPFFFYTFFFLIKKTISYFF